MLRYAVLSELVGVLVVAIAVARRKRGQWQCNNNGNKSYRYLGRHGHYSPGVGGKSPLQTRSGKAALIPRRAMKWDTLGLRPRIAARLTLIASLLF
jgi:hypothetical protein